MNKSKKFWSFKSSEEGVGELMLYGDISSSTWWGDEVTPKQFKDDLDALGNIPLLNVYINSGGGDVFAGQAIYSMLKRANCHKTVYIDGIAASIASVIAMAGDEIVMPLNSMMMIHEGWTITVGNKRELRKCADDMEKIDESIVAVYVEKTKMERDEIIALMEAETWFTAEEAVAQGFADKLEADKKVAASINGNTLIVNKQAIDINRYRALQEKISAVEYTPESTTAENSTETPEAVSDNPEEITETLQNLTEQKNHFKKIRQKLLEV